MPRRSPFIRGRTKPRPEVRPETSYRIWFNSADQKAWKMVQELRKRGLPVSTLSLSRPDAPKLEFGIRTYVGVKAILQAVERTKHKFTR
ncbi:MAG: hypothetical protein JWN50_579 [Parcubacteria group bacterium]|nr:hypothetical protein [Parcubacteria group bacterium]